MKKLIVVSLILAVSVMAFGAGNALVIGNGNIDDKLLQYIADDALYSWKTTLLSDEKDFIASVSGNIFQNAYFVSSASSGTSNSSGRRSSTVEERIKQNDDENVNYSPKAGKYLIAMSANEILQENSFNDCPNRGQFITRNALGVKLKFAGVEGFYNVIKTWDNSISDNGYKVSQLGVGVGFIDPEVLRLFVSIVQNDFSELAPYTSYKGYKGEFAKRFKSDTQFTELGGSAEINDVPDNMHSLVMQPLSSYFESSMLDWTPNKRYSAYILATSLTDHYLEPYNYRGLGSASSPLLLANCQANAIIVRASMEERVTDFLNNRYLHIDGQVPLNFNKVFGVDFGYHYYRDDNLDDDTMTQSSDITGGVRISPLCLKNVRIIGSAEYDRNKMEESTEYFNLSGHLIVKISHHFALMGIVKYRSIWLRDEGFTKFDGQSCTFGSSLSARL